MTTPHSLRLLMIVVSSSLPLLSATDTHTHWNFGIKGSVQFCGITQGLNPGELVDFTIANTTTKSIVAHAEGMSVDWAATPSLVVRGELLYSVTGYEDHPKIISGVYGRRIVRQHFLELPCVLRYSFITGQQTLVPYLEGGFSYSHFLRHNVEFIAENSSPSNPYDASVDKSNLQNDINIILGTGLSIALGKHYSLYVGGRYTFGTTKRISYSYYPAVAGGSNSVPIHTFGGEYYNRRISIDMGLSLPLFQAGG